MSMGIEEDTNPPPVTPSDRFHQELLGYFRRPRQLPASINSSFALLAQVIDEIGPVSFAKTVALRTLLEAFGWVEMAATWQVRHEPEPKTFFLNENQELPPLTKSQQRRQRSKEPVLAEVRVDEKGRGKARVTAAGRKAGVDLRDVLGHGKKR